MRKILFSIPTTLFRKEMFERNLDTLLRQIKLNDVQARVLVLAEKSEFFDKLGKEGVEKKYKNPLDGGKSGNRMIDSMCGEDYLCFIHDDLHVLDDKWIDKFIEFYEANNAGEIGLEWHTRGFIKMQPVADIVTWSDGVFFVSSDVIKKVGRFDEYYKYDCDVQDYCYRIRLAGYKNYKMRLPYKHEQIPLSRKIPGVHDYLDNSRREYAHLRSVYEGVKVPGTDELIQVF